MLTNAPALEDRFAADGFLVLRNWLDVERYILPIQQDLARLIEHAARACGRRFQAASDPGEFDRGYLDLIAAYPEIQPLVYDNAKALLSFQRLIVCSQFEELFSILRKTGLIGAGRTASGIRIDCPHDEFHSNPWHQEFPGQFHSLDGLTFWMPLIDVTSELGPVIVAPKSHLDGVAGQLVDVSGRAESDFANGAYGGLQYENGDSIGDRYALAAPESRPGDTIVLDYLTLHRSGVNVGTRARWSVQVRYFNFSEAFGARMHWMGGFRAGTTLARANAVISEARTFGLR